MTRYKGASRKGAPDTGDLATLARIVRELQQMEASINMHHPSQHPIAAARATVFAAWAEVSGEGFAWSLPIVQMMPDGQSRRLFQRGLKDQAPGSPSTPE